MAASTSLWRSPDFTKLWLGWTVSRFGSLMGVLQYTALVALEAGPREMGLLTAIGVAPGLAGGLFVGVWVDQVRRRPILIAADVGRAASIACVLGAYLAGVLRVEHLYVVAFVHGLLSACFEIAHPAYVPTLVARDRLLEANSKLTASESVVESVAFSLGGWVLQLFGAMAAMVTNVASFLMSALAIFSLRKAEERAGRSAGDSSVLGQVAEGLVLSWRQPLLRAMAGAAVARGLMYGVIGEVILVFGYRELGIPTGILGTIFAVGGLSSALGASIAGRLTRRY